MQVKSPKSMHLQTQSAAVWWGLWSSIGKSFCVKNAETLLLHPFFFLNFWRIQFCNSTQGLLWTPCIMLCLNIRFENWVCVGKASQKHHFHFTAYASLYDLAFMPLRNAIKAAVWDYGLLLNLLVWSYPCLLPFTIHWNENLKTNYIF